MQGLSVGAMAAVGGAIGYLQTTIATGCGGHLPQTGAQWATIAIGAVLAAGAHLVGVYQLDPVTARERAKKAS
jgi:hypothetical protein